MREYVSKITVEIDGAVLPLSSVTEPDEELHQFEEDMQGGGVSETVSERRLSMVYKVPKNEPEYDFSAIRNKKITLDYHNGRRVSYLNCYIGKIGGAEYAAKGAGSRTVEVITGRKVDE